MRRGRVPRRHRGIHAGIGNGFVRAKELLPNVVSMAIAVFTALWLTGRTPVLAQAAPAPQSRPSAPISATTLNNPLSGLNVEGIQIRGNTTVPESLIRNVIRTRV